MSFFTVSNNIFFLVGVVGNISACHADARGSIPRLGVSFLSIEKKFHHFYYCKKDAPTRDRTEDLSVNSRTLYQLSHGGTAEEETSNLFTKKLLLSFIFVYEK